MAFTIEIPRLLVVEGEDDKRFFHAFLDREEVDDVGIFSMGGKDQF